MDHLHRLQALRWPLVLCCLGFLIVSGGVPHAGQRGVHLVSSAQAAETRFVDGFEDLPLMPGLTQEPDAMTAFDSPYGRIIESYASGRGKANDVWTFYEDTLPQLGWERVSRSGRAEIFRREGEDLTVEVTQKGPAVTVRFQSSPH